MEYKANLQDVAKKAGVSICTVSRTIHNKGYVSAETRQKILKAVKELNYQPNRAARSLAYGKTHNLGIIMNRDLNEYDSIKIFNSIIINGISDIAEAHNYSLLLAMGSNQNLESKISEVIENVDGMLIINVVKEEILKQIIKKNIPVVLVDNHFDNKKLPAVNNDDYLGAYIGTKHLLSIGYRDIGYFGIEENSFNRECEKGFRKALTEFGVTMNSNIYAKCKGSLESGFHGMKKIIKQKKAPRAIFAVNDEIAIGAMRAIKDSGLRVPEDIAVVGMDDMPLLDYVETPLTTVRIHISEIGKKAVWLLINLINENKDIEYQITIPPVLVIRKSCGSSLNI
jgi:DNA-binding LacI/PurR family transcriptional regulator